MTSERVQPIRPTTVEAVASRLRAAGCIFAEDEAHLLLAESSDRLELDRLVEARCSGVPLEHLLGWAEFGGRRLRVGPGVFVPRARTELLVRIGVGLLQPRLVAAGRDRVTAPAATAVDLCCGCGAVGLVIAAALNRPAERDVRLYAVDIDPAAVALAAVNIGGRGQVYAGDLYAPLPSRLRGQVDLVVANAPYVPTAELPFMPAEARRYEPHAALDGGPDGLDVVRRVVREAPRWLAPNGSVIVEASRRQVDEVCAAMHRAGLVPEVAYDEDLAATAVAGQRPARPPGDRAHTISDSGRR
ncbi:MAG TPA: putative protein N(5)-glutamine methyltransferase [Nocardioidaceae bacterium]|nr:putative protein N(5)-glutamine methyltransferase [Nocardioidaceae bacterium]